MGGNALKTIKSRRVIDREFEFLCNKVKLPLIGSATKHSLIPAYRNKASFGDADFVVNFESVRDLIKFVKDQYNPLEIVRNHNTVSFDFYYFQVDFINHDVHNFDSALNYYSYDPVGNAVGKLFHQFGLKYGHDGLSFKIREEHLGLSDRSNSHVLKDVVLTKDTEHIHTFLGLDHSKWLSGFDTQEEIFDWVCSSPFFNPARFSFDEMNHEARTRDRKRPSYNMLLEYIETNKHKYTCYKRRRSKKDYMDVILNTFPTLHKEMMECYMNYTVKKEASRKFNGNLVRSWIPYISDVQLGKVVSNFKKMFYNFDFDLYDMTEAEVKYAFICSLYTRN
jgi:hypothetical protein